MLENYQLTKMDLTQEQIAELYANREYASYSFNVCAKVNQSYQYAHITKDHEDKFSNQPVKIENSQPCNSNYYSNYFYNRHFIYRIAIQSNEIFICQRKDSREGKEFYIIKTLLEEHPKHHQFYLGELKENCDGLELVVFLNIESFRSLYNEKKYLSKNVVSVIQKYALNKYKIYNIKDCSDETEYNELNPNFKLKLFDYQAQTLSWMIRTENNDYKTLVPKSCYFKITDKAYVSVEDTKEESKGAILSQYVYENDYQEDIMVRCRGGILADIMGNGKTITCIALIYHNRPSILPTLTSIVEREVYVASKATLVVCPTNIASQWESEIIKCLGPSMGGLKVIKIQTSMQMKKYTLKDLVNCDLIITSYDWITHKNHLGRGFINKGGSTEVLAEQKKNRAEFGEQYELYKNYSLLFIKYHRIFYDEFHEEIDSTSSQNIFLYLIKNCLSAQNIFGISGTPLLENEKILNNIPNLLKITDTNNQIYELDQISRHVIFDKFIRRNEKQYLPPINYRAVMIKQNIQEKQLYDCSLSQSTETLLQLCNYHNHNSLGVQSIDDVGKIQSKLREEQKIKLEEDINDLNINIKQIETILKSLNPNINNISDLFYLIDPNDPKHTHKLVLQIQQTPILQLQVDHLRQFRKYSKQLENTTDELKKLIQCMDYYKQTLTNNLVNGQFLCPIMGISVGEGEVVITKDGHLFSKEGIEMLFESGDGEHITCPVNGNKLTRADISIVTNKKTDTDSLNTNERMFGSKITKIIDEINILEKSKKVIIFCEWQSLIRTISSALDHNKINHVAIKGNIGIRDKAIRDFQKDPNVRVILLSSQFGASGVNLVEASEVYIVHPFLGENGQQYERQAIGRSYRTGQKNNVNVSFFITENTIEEGIWTKNKKNYNV